jgi:hypothetical protein
VSPADVLLRTKDFLKDVSLSGYHAQACLNYRETFRPARTLSQNENSVRFGLSFTTWEGLADREGQRVLRILNCDGLSFSKSGSRELKNFR